MFFFNSSQSSLLKNEYFLIFSFFFIAIIFAFLIIILSYLLVIQKPETEKLSSYECGFEPYEDARHQFDVKFYLVAILFIIFDIEAMYLYPWCLSISQLNLTGFWAMIDFIIELAIGFMYIWLIGALNWK
uniref:NADH-ubiquinone oxidoreductase chain 3 n=1 Tax=Melosira undulata TaxID=2133757 RepID=A0A3G1PWD6_9STRA|nr:NADH dehydrogenase subunit 3 [Melosira undulata]AVR57550.1 NADH dehydrogenase subunit 3 [Melosira undulata]